MSSYQSINHQGADQATCPWPIKYCNNSNFGHLFPTFRHPFDRLFNYPKSFHGLVHRFHGIYYIFFQFWNMLIQILDTSFQVLNLCFKFFNLDLTSLLLHLWLRLLPLAEFIALHWLIVELLESRPKLILAKLDRTKILNRARRARFNILVRSNLAILTEVYSPIIAIT